MMAAQTKLLAMASATRTTLKLTIFRLSVEIMSAGSGSSGRNVPALQAVSSVGGHLDDAAHGPLSSLRLWKRMYTHLLSEQRWMTTALVLLTLFRGLFWEALSPPWRVADE